MLPLAYTERWRDRTGVSHHRQSGVIGVTTYVPHFLAFCYLRRYRHNG